MMKIRLFGMVKALAQQQKELAIEFSSGGQNDSLVGVSDNQWRRPQPVDQPDNPTPEDWKLRVPFQGLLYKVMREKQADGTRPTSLTHSRMPSWET